ncbi:restriction endonuclease [Novosphingobium sediminicola]|nr:restriction endonuclease [Novosphingobium sediminicola]
MVRRRSDGFQWARNFIWDTVFPVRRRKSGFLSGALSLVIIIVMGIAFIFALIIRQFLDHPIVFTLIIVSLGIVFHIYQSNISDDFDNKIQSEMNENKSTLVSLYRTSIHHDPFGNPYRDKWVAHIDNFLRTRVVPEVRNYEQWRVSERGKKAAQLVDEFTVKQDREQRNDRPSLVADPRDLTPAQYEQHCADILSYLGWSVRVTQASRDHGADVIAEKYGHRLVLQCKRYAQPVGNKGVQEAYSALHLYDGSIACVVAPAGFTAQAKREATGLRVQLLHHAELEALDSRLQAAA